MITFKGYLTELYTTPLKSVKKDSEAERVRARQKQVKKDLADKAAETQERGREEIEKARRHDFERQQRERKAKKDKKDAAERSKEYVKEYVEDGTDEMVDAYLEKIPCQDIKKV